MLSEPNLEIKSCSVQLFAPKSSYSLIQNTIIEELFAAESQTIVGKHIMPLIWKTTYSDTAFDLILFKPKFKQQFIKANPNGPPQPQCLLLVKITCTHRALTSCLV